LTQLVATRFQTFARQHLPDYFAEIASQSRDTFLQAIFSASVTRQYSQRVCVLGDASTLAPPFTASGVMKAVVQAIDLARRLQSVAHVTEALTAWSAEQTAFGRMLFELGERMEQPLIWETPDFAALDAASALRWWQAATQLPPTPTATRARAKESAPH
jgi:2-polyprenyl-6-methoxyphenol hydroxylase-like FAD-dependent oxidoreductase